MDKLVLLSFGNGNLQSGFPSVTAQLWEPNNPHPAKFSGCLPAAPELVKLYRHWQLLYLALYHRIDFNLRIEIEAADVTNVSEMEFGDLCQQLSHRLNSWLNSDSFRAIDQRLRTLLHTSDEVRVIVETDSPWLRRLPWHLWQFFEDYPKAEIAISACNYQRPRSIKQSSHTKVRILAILGNSRGIDVNQDRSHLEQLHQAETVFLVEPTVEALNEQLWQDWDILFFAGHSSSQEQGFLQLNLNDRLSIDQLRYALQHAIARGLKLAIFNSCDGLGLAQSLADLHIPQIIVMREPVPDVVAQKFLKYFLASFSNGQSLYVAVREARERLQGIENIYPCATWLPVICQNPAEPPTTWQEWCCSISVESERPDLAQRLDPTELTPSRIDIDGGQKKSKPQNLRDQFSRIHRFRLFIVTSAILTVAIFVLRFLGLLQPWELQAYDQLMRWRPNEPQDQRLLVVTIGEEDFQLPEQAQRQHSISDLALLQLLRKLEALNPRAIGLDIYRDRPSVQAQTASPIAAELSNYLQRSDRFFIICKASDAEANHPGVAPPPEVPVERQGFSDMVQDPDGVLRRHLLAIESEPASPCTTPYALSAQLAFHYLAQDGVGIVYTSDGQLQVGAVLFEQLHNHRGGYHQIDTRGYQILLNYRSHRSPVAIAPTVTLSEVLNGSLQEELVNDRIVLIGVTADSAGDYHATPYSANQDGYQKMAGVMVQAQMTSQIISAVKDGRSLLKIWAWWREALWIWGWAMVGAILAWRYCARSLHLLLATVISIVGLHGFCLYMLIKGFWVPLIPAVLAIVGTGGIVVTYLRVTTRKNHEIQH